MKTVLYLYLCILISSVSILCKGALCASTGDRELVKVIFTGPVLPDLVELNMIEGVTSHLRQRPYRATVHDVIKTDKKGQRILVRKGHIKGFLVGRKGDYLATFEKLSMPVLPEGFWDSPGTYGVTSSDDPAYKVARHPLRVFRKSVPDDAVITLKGLESALLHKIFLKLPSAMKKGRRYIFSLDRHVSIGPFEMVYRPFALRSSAIHISQAGYHPDDSPKIAFVSEWLGSGGGLDFGGHREFAVIDNRTGKEVYSGNMTVASEADSFDDAHAKNFNGTNIWQADFSQLKKTGSYRVCVKDVGCSWPVHTGENVWRDVHRKAVRVFYHQRSGIATGPPYSSFRRPASFIPGRDIKVYQSVTPLMATPNGFIEGDDNFKKLVYGSSDIEMKNAWGGYFDAGDWDRRIQHLKLARYLLDLYSRYPDFYKKFGLNIPESGNSMPDILDEALWSVDFFKRLQDDNGGVRGGVESAGHPFYGEASWQESHRVYAYAPGVWSSYLYAATAARAASVIKKLMPARGVDYRKSALKAMEWSEKEVRRMGGLTEPEVRDARNLAASELFRLTGDESFHRIFLRTTVFRKPDVPLRKYEDHDQAEAAWSYVNLSKKKRDAATVRYCLEAVMKGADAILAAQKKAGFKWAKRPWIPAFGGAFTSPDIPEVVWAWWLTGEKKYLSSLMLAMQFTLGANPLNISYMTGVGYAFPKHVMNIDARITGQRAPEGITVLGPLDFDQLGGSENSYYRSLGKKAFPDPLLCPVMETFWDVFWFPMMCEYSIEKMAGNALITGVLVAR